MINLLLIIAMSQGLLIAFFILTSKFYRTAANKWLAIALILLSVNGVLDIISQVYSTRNLLIEFFLNDIELGLLVYVPLLIFFKLSADGQQSKKPLSTVALLSLPFIIDTIINLYIVLTYPIETISDTWGVQIFYSVETVAEIIYAYLLCFVSYRIMNSGNERSEKKKWVYRIWLTTLILISVWTLIAISDFLLTNSDYFISILYAFISLWLFWLMYNGIVNLKLINDRQGIREALDEDPSGIMNSKFEDSRHNLTEPQSAENFENHFSKIRELVTGGQLYLNEDLSLNDVADEVGLSTGYVSKIIKQVTDKSFTTWINELRVEHAQKLLVDTRFDNYTTLAIGFESGFKSKSAYYSSFKKIVGTTPAKFRE